MKQPVIIIGMHRSGTTMLTRILEKTGLFMGHYKDENDESFFFVNFNKWMMKNANSSWDNPYCFNFINDNFKSHIKRVYDKRQKSLFAIKYLGFKDYWKYKAINNIDFRWGWKDPRNTFTIDIWKEIYPKAKILHIYRNPVDVANSLKVRSMEIEDKYVQNFKIKLKEKLLIGSAGYTDSYRIMDIREGFNLWQEYVYRALKEKSALHIKYEDLLFNPNYKLTEIFQFLELDVDGEKMKHISNYFDSGRRYAFLKNAALVNFYKKIQNNDLVKKLEYDKINNKINK